MHMYESIHCEQGLDQQSARVDSGIQPQSQREPEQTLGETGGQWSERFRMETAIRRNGFDGQHDPISERIGPNDCEVCGCPSWKSNGWAHICNRSRERIPSGNVSRYNPDQSIHLWHDGWIRESRLGLHRRM